MAIRASSAHQVDTLIADLGADSAVTREAAVARLTVYGARAVERLIAAAGAATPAAARVAAFRALEAIGDPRALDAAVRAVADADAAVAAAAINTARVFIPGPRGAAVVDALTAVAVDRHRPDATRVAALRSLMDLERWTLAPLLGSLAADPSAVVRAEVARYEGVEDVVEPAEALKRASEQALPDEPRALQAAIVSAGDAIALPVLLAIVERVRERERSEPPERRMEWTTTRAAAHAALARRGSRIGIYDLRESLDGAENPLPVEFLAALSSVGDASCLEAIAGAYARSSAKARRQQNDWWREHLADTFRTIVGREKITRRHAVAKRIEKRWPQAITELWVERPPGSGGSGGSGRAGGRPA